MGMTILQIDSSRKKLQNYGYIDTYETDEIISLAKSKSLRCLKFLDQCDDAIFNHKQLKEITKELKVLEQNSSINQKVIDIITNGLEETLKYPDQFLAFIGD